MIKKELAILAFEKPAKYLSAPEKVCVQPYRAHVSEINGLCNVSMLPLSCIIAAARKHKTYTEAAEKFARLRFMSGRYTLKPYWFNNAPKYRTSIMLKISKRKKKQC